LLVGRVAAVSFGLIDGGDAGLCEIGFSSRSTERTNRAACDIKPKLIGIDTSAPEQGGEANEWDSV
jgi:hypothetical protein